MAVLTPAQLAELRQAVASGLPLSTIKPMINQALQDIEDWFDANRASLAAAITGGFTNAQKKQLVKYWLLQKFGRE